MISSLQQTATAEKNISLRPFVSIIIPCRNERSFIGRCLDSVLANDYPRDRLEMLVVDGMSEDGTREILDAYAEKFSFIRRIDNSKKTTPVALNLGIRKARGDIIIRMDAHASIERPFISRSVEALEKYQADNVGGIMITHPQSRGFFARAITQSLSCTFGVGNSHFRVHVKKPRWVDTVFGGCYRHEVFERIGCFNEKLSRGQDIEFNLRLKKAGGKILLVPNIVSHYHARAEFKTFLRHNFMNGEWVVLPFFYSDIVPVSLRHLVPFLFVASLAISVLLSSFWSPFRWVFLFIAVSYLAASSFFAARIAMKERSLLYLLIMPLVFLALHSSYGIGSLWGMMKGFAQQVSLIHRSSVCVSKEIND